MDSGSMSNYRYENEPEYTQEQMDRVIKGVKEMFGRQIEANDGTMLVSTKKYNKFVDLVLDL